jgi:transcriptional regulator with XRE-family HTH domain
MMERNSKLEAARRLRGWTLEVASQKIGVHPRTLRRWENGQSRPHGFRVYKISEIYETTPTALGIGSECHQLFCASEGTPQIEQSQLLAHIADPLLTIEDLDLHLMGLILQRKLDRQDLNYRVFQQHIDQCIKEYDAYMQTRQSHSPADPARQQALSVVASIPIAAYLENLTPHALPAPPEDILTHCASAITVCWHMGQRADLALARALVSGYLILLLEVFERVAYCRQATAELIAQACLLRTMLAHQLEEPHTGITYYARALKFSWFADTAEVQSVSPIHPRARYGKQPKQSLRNMAESLWLLKTTSPLPDFSLIRDYLQKISAVYQLPLVSGQRASEQLFAEQFEAHQIPPTLDYAGAALNLWDGMTYHELNTYAQALDNMRPNTSDESARDIPEQVRTEFLANRALAALRLHDMDQAVTTMRATIPQTLSLGSERKMLETRSAYHLMQFLLPGDSPTTVVELKDLLQTHD